MVYIRLVILLTNNKNNIALVNKEVASVQIIDVAVPANCNVTSKEAEKVEKYTNFSAALCHCGKMKCEIISIAVGCLGCVTPALKSN